MMFRMVIEGRNDELLRSFLEGYSSALEMDGTKINTERHKQTYNSISLLYLSYYVVTCTC